MHLSGNTVGRDLNVTLGNPSVYETMGRDAYLARALEDSDSRIERRRLVRVSTKLRLRGFSTSYLRYLTS
ncbi:hypothetical protein L839_5653 [Mycobacterium avium MAV_120809_2495]|nr:hypothetical protein L839_5653 [Mycobacterium avium MAV_120809_2495]